MLRGSPAEDALGLQARRRREGSDRQDRRAGAAPDRQFRRPRSAARGARMSMWFCVEPGRPLPGEAALVLLPGSKTTIDDLASSARSRLGTSTCRRMSAAAAGCSGSAAATRCWAIASTIPSASRAGRRSVEGLGLLDVATTLTGEEAARGRDGYDYADGAPFSGYEMHIGETAGPDSARPFARSGGWPARRRGLGRWPRRRHICARPVLRRPAAGALARIARRRDERSRL